MATEQPKDQKQKPAEAGGQNQQESSRQESSSSQPASAAAPSSTGSSGVGQPAKCVFIFRNGDAFAPSKKFVLNRRQLRDWDVFLEQVTLSVNPLRGAVRNIVTPRRGRRRILDLDSFDDKAHYVALARGERFKPITYVPEGDVSGTNGTPDGQTAASPQASPRRPIGNNRVVLEPILPVVHNKKLMSVQPRFGTKMEVISSQSKAIRVYRNGDEFTPAIITMLRPAEQVSMEVVLRAVEERVVLPNNMAIRKLYDLNGRPIRDPQELQHEKHYVAGGREPFLARSYGHKLPVVIIGKAERMSSIKYLSQPITPEKHTSRRSKADQQQQQQQEEPTAAGKGGSGASKEEKAKAASAIQASARGFQTRIAAAEKQTGGPVAIKPLPANSKANNAKAKAKAKPAPTKEEQEKSASAIQASAIQASAIQASARGFQARKDAAAKVAKKPVDIRNDPANSKANSGGRQKPQAAAKRPPMSQEEKAAAESIQASVNSYKTRKTVAKQEAGKASSAGGK